MPGPQSDSFDSEFGTSANCNLVTTAMRELRQKITTAIGTAELDYVLDVVQREDGPRQGLALSERELRILRFSIDRALETL